MQAKGAFGGFAEGGRFTSLDSKRRTITGGSFIGNSASPGEHDAGAGIGGLAIRRAFRTLYGGLPSITGTSFVGNYAVAGDGQKWR